MRRLFGPLVALLCLTGVALAQFPGFNNPPSGGNVTNNIVNNNTLSLATNALLVQRTNNTGTGTTTNKLVKEDGAGNVVLATITDLTNTVGICDSNTGTGVVGCGSTGSSLIAVDGQESCVFDGATTAGDYVGVSTGTNGDCTDLGTSSSATPPTGVQILGIVQTTNVGAGTYKITIDHEAFSAAAKQQNNSNNPCAGKPLAKGTQAAGGTLTLDFSKSCSFTATFGAGNLTITASNLAAGDCGFLALTQDGVGSRTVSWNALFKWAAATAPTLSTGASKTDLITFCSPSGSTLAGQLSVADYR